MAGTGDSEVVLGHRQSFRPPELSDASQEIRLLRIHPPIEGEDDETVRCSISVHSLAAVNRKYVAISYTWGSEEPKHVIYIDGLAFQARKNCWYALLQMRSHDTKPLYWIDSICIDQSSNEEKQEQVARMGHIYSQAQGVAACIGPSIPGLDIDAFLEGLYSKFHGRRNIDERDPSMIEALEQIASCSYFQRLWTTQECVLARKTGHLNLHYARDYIPMRDAWDVLHREEFEARGSLSLNLKRLVVLVNHFQFGRVCQRHQGHRHGDDIAYNILAYGRRLCSDPRDKIYGLMAMCGDTVVNRIRVSYTAPLLRVLLQYATVYDHLSFRGWSLSTDGTGSPATSPTPSLTGSFLPMIGSISFLITEFAKADRAFATKLEEFCRRRLLVSDIPSFQPSAGAGAKLIKVQVRGAKFHQIDWDEQHLEFNGEFLGPGRYFSCLCDTLFEQEHAMETISDPLRSPYLADMLSGGLHEVVYDEEVATEWLERANRFFDTCSCSTNIPTYLHSDPAPLPTNLEELARDMALRSQQTWSEEQDSILMIRREGKDNGDLVVFAVPSATRKGDLLLLSPAEKHEGSRTYLVCRKVDRGGFTVIGRAIHLLGMRAFAVTYIDMVRETGVPMDVRTMDDMAHDYWEDDDWLAPVDFHFCTSPADLVALGLMSLPREGHFTASASTLTQAALQGSLDSCRQSGRVRCNDSQASDMDRQDGTTLYSHIMEVLGEKRRDSSASSETYY